MGSRLDRPWQVAADTTGRLIVSQVRPGRKSGNVLRLSMSGRRSIVAGPGARGQAGRQRFRRIAGVAVRADGAILVADHDVVRGVSPAGAVTVVAGGEDFPQNRGIYIGQGEGLAEAGSELLVADAGTNQVHRVPADPSAAVRQVGIHPQASLADLMRGYSARIVERGSRARADQPPGSNVCVPGQPRSWKAFRSTKGMLFVRFGGARYVQVTLLRRSGSAEQQIFRKDVGRKSPRRVLRVRSKGLRGTWYARVRWKGSRCNQSGPWRL